MVANRSALDETIRQIARESAMRFVKGNGPWKDSDINLPDDDNAVQHFTLCALKAANAVIEVIGAELDKVKPNQ